MAGRRPLTREVYDSLLAAYRESPGSIGLAARRAGVCWQLASRAWKGPRWKDYPWAVPIREVLDDERRAALARARDLERERARAEAELADAEREKARREYVEALAQEQQMLKLARADVLSGLALAAELTPAMRQLTRVVQAACAPQPDGSPPDIAPAAAMTLLTRHAGLMSRAVAATEAVVELSRLDRGDPTAIFAVQPTVRELTYEEAIEELEAGVEMLADLKARGALPGQVS
jgi:hypothetical protein